MKTILIALFLLLAMAQDPGEIRNFLRVNKDFCTGGQPRLEHLEKLKADGVKVDHQPAPTQRTSRRRRRSKSERARLALLQHPGRFRQSKRRTGRRVSEDHRRSGESSRRLFIAPQPFASARSG